MSLRSTNTAIPNSLLTRLRQETAQSHQALEDSICIEQRIQNVPLYRELLEKFYGYYAPLEVAIEAVPGWEMWNLNFSERRKRPSLVQDLKALGLDDAEIDALPVCTELPEVDTIAAGFGCAYVLEGSTLGGRHISAMLDRSEIPQNARSFFKSYGSDVGLKWKEFLAALENFSETNLSPELTVNAAENTFTYLQVWMSEGDNPS